MPAVRSDWNALPNLDIRIAAADNCSPGHALGGRVTAGVTSSNPSACRHSLSRSYTSRCRLVTAGITSSNLPTQLVRVDGLIHSVVGHCNDRVGRMIQRNARYQTAAAAMKT